MYIIEGDPEKSFFEQNPEIRYFAETKALISSCGEEEAGIYMWAAYMFEDPRSKIYKVPIDERTDIVINNYAKERMKDFSKSKFMKQLDPIRMFYPKLILSKTQILYKGYADQMDEFMVYTKSLPIASQADKKLIYLEKMTKMWPTYEKVSEKMVEEQEETSRTREGVHESYREKRTRR